jgi:ethanolamine permease
LGLKKIARYNNVSNRYLQKRQLRGDAGWLLLWGMGVGAAIVGEFSGWNYGLAAGGFWGLAIACVLMAIMYLCLVCSLAELSVALPHAGGMYSFVRNAFNPFWGFICGLMLIVEFVPGAAVILVNITDYLRPLIPDSVPVYLVWLLINAIFLAINILSVSWTFYVSLILTLAAIVVLGVFYLSMSISGVFQPELLFNIPADLGESQTWLPKGGMGIFAAIPYAIWFYLAIEQLPMAAEETRDVAKNMPRALIVGMFTLIVLSLLTLVLNTGVGGGAAEIGQSDVPLAVAYKAYFGKRIASTVTTAWMLAVGAIASFHAGIYASGRVLFSLSRAGYLPRWISVTNKNRIPQRALLVSSFVGLVCVVLLDVFKGEIGQIFLYTSVFAALFSYILSMLSYIELRISRSQLPRPYKSPLGIWGAYIAMATFALVACVLVPDYQPSFFGVCGFVVVGIVYFWFWGRHRLVPQAQEEGGTR